MASGNSRFVMGTVFFQLTPRMMTVATTPLEIQGDTSRICKFSFNFALRSCESSSAYAQSRIAFFLSLNRGINSIIIIKYLECTARIGGLSFLSEWLDCQDEIRHQEFILSLFLG